MTVDAFASQPHYHAHIWPIWQELQSRGTFTVTPACRHLPHDGIGAAPDYRTGRPVIVAGHQDLVKCHRRPAVLVEHGAGQTYIGLDDGAYAGGRGRDSVVLFICPNETVAVRNLARYPDGLAVAVGSPRLESVARRVGPARTSLPFRPGRPPTVAVSFHWDCRVVPEARWAFPHYQPHLPALAGRFDLIGHGHPRAWPALSRYWKSVGAEPVGSFTETVSRADVYVVDNSSTLFEAAALGLDVVVMDAPWYRPHINHGLRFWEWADIGPRVHSGDQLVDAALQAVTDRDQYATVRDRMVEAVYGVVDGAARRAARAIDAL